MKPTLKFIGIVHSSLKTIDDCPLQEFENAPEASIAIFSEFVAAVTDIDIGSEIVLLTWLHKADRSVLRCIPRKNYGAPQIGVFSTRSPDRPNPIGMHIVKVLSITDGGVISVSGLEVLDQTPVIDIKPVLAPVVR
jgi:tRNA-Thr(GGU) m(6)t(6)A37 methyltransferase TsaA